VTASTPRVPFLLKSYLDKGGKKRTRYGMRQGKTNYERGGLSEKKNGRCAPRGNFATLAS